MDEDRVRGGARPDGTLYGCWLRRKLGRGVGRWQGGRTTRDTYEYNSQDSAGCPAEAFEANVRVERTARCLGQEWFLEDVMIGGIGVVDRLAPCRLGARRRLASRSTAPGA